MVHRTTASRPPKAAADHRVERSLYGRAAGYSYRAQKVVVANGVSEVVEFIDYFPRSRIAVAGMA